MGIFLGLSLLSFDPSDPSLNSIGKTLNVQNYCGYIGSFLADLFFQVFGLGAWLLVAGGINKAVQNFRGVISRPAKLRWLWACLLIITGSSLLSLYWPELRFFNGQISVGGILGETVSKALASAFNSIGVQILLWTSMLALVVFYTEKTLGELFTVPKNQFLNVYDWVVEKQPWHHLGQATLSIFAEAQGFFKNRKPVLAAEAVKEQVQKLDQHFFPIEPEEVDEEFEEAMMAEAESSEPAKRRKVRLKKKVQRRIENWELPKIEMLEDPPFNRKKVSDKEIQKKAQILVNKLAQFNVNGEVTDAKPGPAVTMFEFRPDANVKISKITELADDLSLALSAESVRIIAPIPGRDVVGIETSNATRETVYLKEILANEDFWEEDCFLPLAAGCEADGSQKIVDLRRMPHLLVAGTTGSGKSVFIVGLLTGLLFRHSPKSLRLILIDPKQVDLAAFNDIPHLLMPPIREPKKAISALRWAIKEMEKRYRSMAKFGARDLESFNAYAEELSTDEIVEHEEINDPDAGLPFIKSYYYTPQPYICVVCEEFGDLMAVDKTNVEQCVVRLAQMARACGIHLILAMQSPRKDVITGLIKTNIPGRVSFKVNSKMDSRIILDESGGERLLSRGDMLFVSPGTSKPVRHHGPWVTDGEIEEVTDFWTNQAEPEYDPLAMKALEGSTDGFDGADPAELDDEEFDERYDEILAYVSTLKEVSASLLQRKFRLGYPRAARLIEVFESEGVVGPPNGSKPRMVLIEDL